MKARAPRIKNCHCHFSLVQREEAGDCQVFVLGIKTIKHFAYWPPEDDGRPHIGRSYRSTEALAWEIWEGMGDDFVKGR